MNPCGADQNDPKIITESQQYLRDFTRIAAEETTAAAGLASGITFARNLVPGRPGRRYERKTKRPGGRYKTRKPGETTRLTPLTRIVFWPVPIPRLT